MIVEGSAVSYVGDDPLVGVGTQGKVLSVSGAAVYVLWAQGVRVGSIEMVEDHDLVPVPRSTSASVTAQFADSLLVSAPAISVRATYEETGPAGVVSALSEQGYLAVFGEYADEAYTVVTSRLRADPAFAVMLSSLDESDAEMMVRSVSATLLRDLIAGEESE